MRTTCGCADDLNVYRYEKWDWLDEFWSNLLRLLGTQIFEKSRNSFLIQSYQFQNNKEKVYAETYERLRLKEHKKTIILCIIFTEGKQ